MLCPAQWGQSRESGSSYSLICHEGTVVGNEDWKSCYKTAVYGFAMNMMSLDAQLGQSGGSLRILAA